MKNVNINDITSKGDVDFDQEVDVNKTSATQGGVAIGGSVAGSAINTGRNDGVMAGDDVRMEDSIVGHGNTQINDSTVGAFSGRGDATNVAGHNVNLGRGDLIDVNSGGDAQVVTGHGNRVSGDTNIDVDRADGPMNFAIGDNNRQNALEDNSTHIEDSYNTDNSIEDSFNTRYDRSFNTHTEDNDSYSTSVRDSFNTSVEDNDTYESSWSSKWEDNSSYEDNSSWSSKFNQEQTNVDIYGDRNEVDLDD